MQIVELGDYSMVIENAHANSMDMLFPRGEQSAVKVFSMNAGDSEIYPASASEILYTKATIILYFKDKISESFNVGERVGLIVDDIMYM